MIKKLCILVFLCSCNKVYDVHKKNGVYFLKDVQTKVQSLKDIEWDIGKSKEATISKGLRFSSSIPNLSQESKIVLSKRYGVDSWLIQISRIRKGQKVALGHFYIRLANMTRTTKDFTVNLYYHAAAVSKRFRMFHCPAFNHRLRLEDYDLVKTKRLKSDDIFIRPIRRLNAKAIALQFAPMVVSGGRSLLGKYVVDLAFYNSKRKQIYSNWFPSEGTISITREVNNIVKSCFGVKEESTPLPESKMPSIRDLEIN